MGNALQEQGKLEEAIEAYSKALAIKPDYARGLLQHGHCSQRAKQTGRGDRGLQQRLLAIKPDYARCLLQHGHCSPRAKQTGRGDRGLQQRP